MGQMMIEWTDCRKLPRKDVSLAHYTISHDLCTRAVADPTDRLLFQLLQFCHLDMDFDIEKVTELKDFVDRLKLVVADAKSFTALQKFGDQLTVEGN